MSCLLLVMALCRISYAIDDSPNSALTHAQTLSSLTGPKARPFHLKVSISEPTNPNSPYRATIEEFWQSATLWQRAIDSPDFRQTIEVQGGVTKERDSSDYYPIWLRSFVTASIDPLEDTAFWNQVSARIVQTTTTNGHPSSSCARAQFKIGTASLNNDAFTVICFNSDGTLSSVVRPGYDIEFQDPQDFGKKRIARKYVNDPEPGTNLVGTVEVLEEIDKSTTLPVLPDIPDPSSGPIVSAKINQDAFYQLASGQPGLTWPAVHSGNTRGRLSMYISADRDGRIREAYPLNSDNAGLQEAARDQLLKWKLKPAVSQGSPVQVEAALTFEFATTLENSAGSSVPSTDSLLATPSGMEIVKVSPQIASSLRIKMFAPVYPQALRERGIGGKVVLTAIIGKEGQVVSLDPVLPADPDLTKAAISAVQVWTYRPYLLNGSPVEIETTITVNFQAAR